MNFPCLLYGCIIVSSFSEKHKLLTCITWKACEKVTMASTAVCSPLPVVHSNIEHIKKKKIVILSESATLKFDFVAAEQNIPKKSFLWEAFK